MVPASQLAPHSGHVPCESSGCVSVDETDCLGIGLCGWGGFLRLFLFSFFSQRDGALDE